MRQTQIQCIGNSYQGYIASLKWDQVDPTGYANARQWYYQTCTEFGYCEYLVIWQDLSSMQALRFSRVLRITDNR